MNSEKEQERSEEILQIRNLAVDYLEKKSGRFRVNKYASQLEKIKTKTPSIEWLEATILVRVAGMTRPTRTVSLMDTLAKKRTVAGEEEKFRLFSDRIGAYLHPFRLTPHGYTKAYFSDANNEMALEHIGQLVQRFDAIGYEVILNSGTLLGVVRDKRLIEHDDDVDLAILLKATTRREAAYEWVELLDQLKKIDLLGDADSGQNEIFKLKAAGEFEVDLFPCWIENDRVFIYPHTFGEIDKNSLLPTQQCAITGYKIPANPEAFLAQNYGQDWGISNPYFIFPWPQQKRLFREFIADVKTCIEDKQNNHHAS